ncbi:MAG TPA: hypothetical protein PLQ94_05890, partial [Anaerolineales bacterium]|nr:hypothetical protein [Anaerolineales bacterium]
MKKNLLFKVISLLVIASFALAACGGGTAATEAPAVVTEAPAVATEAPVVTEAPVAAEDVEVRWRTRPDNQEEIDVYS